MKKLHALSGRLPVLPLLLLLAAAPAAAGELPALLEELRAPAVADGWFVEGKEASIGHLTLHLEQGALLPLRAGDSVIGIFFEGTGSYTYRSDDPADLQVLQGNLAARSKGSLYQDGAVRDEFGRIVVFFAAPLFGELLDGAAGSPREASAELKDSFQKFWTRLLSTDLEYDHRAAEARLNGGEAQYVFAEIEGKKDTLGYYYDRVRAYAEGLVAFRKFGGVDIRLMSRLSSQLVDGGPIAHSALAALQEAVLDVATDDNRSGTVVSDLTLVGGMDGVRCLPLALLNNRNPNSFDWASKKNQLRVTRVTGADGTELAFSHRYHELLVELAQPLGTGDTVELHFETEGDFFTSGFGEASDNYFELFTDYWFPLPLSLSAPDLHMSLKVRTKKPFRPVASGTVVSFEEDGNSYVLQTEGKLDPEQIAVFAGKYKVKEETLNGRTLRVYAYAMGTDKAMTTLIGLTDYFLSYFEHTLGPYPFSELDIVEVPEWGFGIAPAGMVLLTSEAYHPLEDYMSQYFSRGINSRLAHEIAHQWFGHKASPRTSRDNWLAESFAEYMAGLAMAVSGADERQVAGFKRMHEQWWGEAKVCKDAGPISAANMISGDLSSRYRYGLLYNRGPLVLHMLRTYIGDDAFFAVLRKYLENADLGPATTADFETAAKEVLGDDISWFVEQWVNQGGIPEVQVTYDFETGEDGGELLVGTAEQVGGPFMKMYIPILLEFGSGETMARFLFLDQPKKGFRLPLKERPKKVTIDPAHNNLAIYH